MSNHFIVPTFNESTPNKLHNELAVTGRNTVSRPIANFLSHEFSAIATESIPTTVDGDYAFAVRIDNIRMGTMAIGVTPMATFDSNKESRPGWNGMSGCALDLHDGNYMPGNNPNLIDRYICNRAKEVIVLVTIANNGARRLIRWIVDGTSSVNRTFPADCKGDKLFPVVSMWTKSQQITTIPIEEVTIHNNEVKKLIAKFPNPTSPSSAALAQLQQELEKERKRADLAGTQLEKERRRADLAEAQLQQEKQQHDKEKQSSNAKDQQLQQKDQQLRQKDQELQDEKKVSAALTTQVRQKDLQLQRTASLASQVQQKDLQLLQKDHHLERKDHQLHDEKSKAANLMTEVKQRDQQVQQKDSEIAQLKQQLLTLQSQLNNNNSPAPSSPFVKDKLYQIDFAANGITPPADPNAFGTLLKLPSQNNSALFQHVKNELWKKLGTSWPSPKGVHQFTLESIEVIYSDIAMLEGRMRRLQQLRSQNGNFFNPPTGAFNPLQLEILGALRDQFLPRSSTADPKSPNLINVFHGTKVDRLQSVVNGLVAVRSTDAGYFGSGVYTTTSIEYAAKYAKGDFDKNGPYPPRASDGCIPVVWCVAAVGVCYPLTREVDYSKKRVHDGMDVSDFFGMPVAKEYDCHCVAVNESVGFQAVPRKEMQYMEVVFDQEVQVLPIAVLWVKSM